MPHSSRSHEENLKLVCSVCACLRGKKAVRTVKDSEAELIKKHVFSKFSKDSIWFPQGICVGCAVDLKQLDLQVREGRGGVNLKLPENYLCNIPTQTRSKASTSCTCRWCKLAQLNGLQFQLWQKSLKKNNSPTVSFICQDCGQGVAATTGKHTCHANDQDRVQALVGTIPEEIKGKLALALLRDQQEQQGAGPSSSLSLPQAEGGKPVQVRIGHPPDQPEQKSLSLEQWEVCGAKAHLTGAQKESVAADLRAVLGQKVFEPGMKLAVPKHNKKFAEYFTSEKILFEGSDEVLEEKILFFCHSPQLFIDALDKERGKEGVPQATIIQGDSGQGDTKVCMTRIDLADLEQTYYTQLPGAGLVFLETEIGKESRKRRRTREQEVEGGEHFKDYGVRKMMILALVHKVKESPYNLGIIFEAIKLTTLQFRLTGDFAFFMPTAGLHKGCSSTHPCPLCDQERSKVGGKGARWLEGPVTLRTFGLELSPD